MSGVDAIREAIRRAEPRHIVVFHPDNEEDVRRAARGYYVTCRRSDLCPPGKVYLIDREAFEGELGLRASIPKGET